MTITKRLISGSVASWIQIIITVLSQIVLVPIYLSYWRVEIYGIWLAIQAFLSILSTIDIGHQTYLGFEFLKIGQDNRKQTQLYLWSSVRIAFIIGFLQVIFVLIVLKMGVLRYLLNVVTLQNKTFMDSAGFVLLLQSIVWFISGSAGGIFVRALSAFNYYPRMAWWGVFATIITALAPALAVTFGADFMVAGIIASCATLFFNIFLYYDILNLLRKEFLGYKASSLRLGWQNLLHSLALSLRNLLENTRNSGVRVILAPLSGAAGLVTFSTIRTGANFAMQGLHTVTNPLMPELMRFLHQRDQERYETAFATVWILIVAIMAPGVVILQTFIEPLYAMWTRGKLPFDPLLFAILSSSVLVYAVAQPAISVVTGNNLVRAQLLISGLAALFVICSMCILVPLKGILGAGIALLGAEIIATASYQSVAKSWLNAHKLSWPRNSANITIRTVLLASVSMGSSILMPTIKWVIVVITLLFMVFNVFRYWRSMPEFARQRTKAFIKNWPLMQRIVVG